MDLAEDVEIECPYCWETFAIQVDTAQGLFTTIEDCAVCCRPISLNIRCRPGLVESVEAAPC